ncbi:MAG: tetratricopeptide repeat protein [Chloroflexota bacterium]
MHALNRFQAALPEASRSWLIAAMRQDTHMWEALLNPADPAWEHLQQAGLPPESWSPAALALSALGQPPDPSPLCSLKAIPNELRRRAVEAFERHTQPRSPLTPEIQTDLVQAGLLALALRERRRLLGSWDNLSKDLRLAPLGTWHTPLACLFGMIPDPEQLLCAIFADGSRREWNRLALHALLSNPLSPNRQVALLERVLSADMLLFLQQLAAARPAVARELAAMLLRQSPSISHESAAHLATLAGEPQTALEQLSEANEILQRRQAALNAQTATLLARFALATPAVIQAQWRQATELDPNQPVYWASLVHALLDDGQTAEAANVLQASISHHEHPDLLLALARLAYETGDKARTRHLAIQALQAIEGGAARIAKGDLRLAPAIDHLAELSKMLLEVGRPLLAAQAAELALQQQPANADMLAILAQARFTAKDSPAGTEALQLAVLVAPENVTLRRHYAQQLENRNDWAAALAERQAVLEYAHPFLSTEEEDRSSPERIADLHTLANCAIHANRPEIAVQACQRALKTNPEDGPLQAMCGEALALLGDEEAAREHFNLATLFSPGLPHPWLALSHDCLRQGQTQKAIETLLAAAQAAPQAADIHLALGKAYLDANAPSQALEALRQAASLAPENKRIALPLGQALHDLGYLDEARQVLEKAWQNTAEIPFGLAYTYAQALLALGHLEQALEPLQVAVNTSPEDEAPYLDYACTLLTLKRNLPQAIKTFRYILDIAPSQVTARAFLAEALVENGDLAAALDAYQSALESELVRDDSWRSRLALGLGQTALALQRTDTAIAALHEASQAAPQNPEVYRTLAHAYLQAGLQQNALQAMRAVLHVNNDSLTDLLWFVDQAQRIANAPGKEASRGKKESNPLAHTARCEALQAIRQAVQIAPHQSMLYLRQARLHIELNDLQAASIVLRILLEETPARPAELHQAAQLLLDPLQDPAGAVACLEKALTLDNPAEAFPSTCDLLSDLAYAHQRNGDPSLALQSIERAIGAGGLDAVRLAELRRAKAHLLLDLGQTEDALSWIETALHQDSQDAELHFLAADILQKEGQLPLALQHTQDAIPLAGVLARLRAAELARSLLRFELGCNYLEEEQRIDKQQGLPAAGYILRAELALEIDAEIDAAEALTQALERTSLGHAAAEPQLRGRILALQARLVLRRGDIPTAHDLYQQACDAAQESQPQLVVDWPAREARAAAALDLGLWEQAIELLRQSVSENALRPYAAYKLAVSLVRRAEAYRLCEKVQAIAHAPGALSIAPTARREFERTVRLAQAALFERENETGAEGNAAAQETRLAYWETRGRLAFQATQQNTSATQPYQVINELLVQAERDPRAAWQAACRFADTVFAQPPGQSPVHAAIIHALLAKLGFQAGEVAAAEESIGVALALWPDEPRWHNLAGKIYLEINDPLRASEHFERAIALEPGQASYHLLYGQAVLELRDQHTAPGELDRMAQQAFQQAVMLEPKQAQAWYALAHTQMRVGEFDQAANSIEKAAGLAPKEVAYWLLRAQIALHGNRPEDALQDARAALKAQPERHTALLLAARALQALNRSAEALELLDSPGLSVQPEKPSPGAGKKPESTDGERAKTQKLLSLQLERINALAQANGPQEALAQAASLAEAHPYEPGVLAVLAHIQAQNGEYDAAIRTAQAALRQCKTATSPAGMLPVQCNEQARLHHLLGDLLRRAGQLDQAVYHLNQAVQLDEQLLEAYLNLGQAQQERRQYRQSLAAYQKAIAIAPQDPRPYLQAGLAFKDGKNYIEAENMLHQAAKLAPKDVAIRRQLAAVVALNLVHTRRKNERVIGAQASHESLPVSHE